MNNITNNNVIIAVVNVVVLIIIAAIGGIGIGNWGPLDFFKVGSYPLTFASVLCCQHCNRQFHSQILILTLVKLCKNLHRFCSVGPSYKMGTQPKNFFGHFALENVPPYT